MKNIEASEVMTQARYSQQAYRCITTIAEAVCRDLENFLLLYPASCAMGGDQRQGRGGLLRGFDAGVRAGAGSKQERAQQGARADPMQRAAGRPQCAENGAKQPGYGQHFHACVSLARAVARAMNCDGRRHTCGASVAAA